MIRKISLIAMTGLFVVLTGCNTFEGFGKDVQKGGEKIENAADKAKK